jgi:inner membrane protein involved in colicin E2 resistance
MTQKSNKTQYRIYMQYVLIGAALGLYYGLFYRGSQSSPDFVMAIILSAVAAFITVIVRSWKKKRSFTEILMDFLKIMAMFAVFLVGLEFRKVIFERWGKTAVAVFTTGIGILIGLAMAIRKKDGELVKSNHQK